MAMTPREMSELVVKWEMEAGESFYEYSGLLEDEWQVLKLADLLYVKGMLNKEGLEEVNSETFPEIITVISNSNAFESGDHNEYMELLDAINDFINTTQHQEEYLKFVRHYINGMDPAKSKVFKDYMEAGKL